MSTFYVVRFFYDVEFLPLCDNKQKTSTHHNLETQHVTSKPRQLNGKTSPHNDETTTHSNVATVNYDKLQNVKTKLQDQKNIRLRKKVTAFHRNGSSVIHYLHGLKTSNTDSAGVRVSVKENGRCPRKNEIVAALFFV